MSHITARIKVSDLKIDLEGLQLGAFYVSGISNGLQYHIQITAIYSDNFEEEYEDLARECPDYAATATEEQLKTSNGYVLFICASLGEIYEDLSGNGIVTNDDPNITTNIKLNLKLSDEEYNVWNIMENATFKVVLGMSSSDQPVEIQYWKEGEWSPENPSVEEMRIDGIVHEGCMFWMGEDKNTSVVGYDYRPHDIKNVYVTGSGIFPTLGSWNPTLTISCFAINLAKKLTEEVEE